MIQIGLPWCFSFLLAFPMDLAIEQESGSSRRGFHWAVGINKPWWACLLLCQQRQGNCFDCKTYKTPKKYLLVTSLQPGVTSESRRSGRGVVDPQTCPNFRLWQNGKCMIPTQNATTWRVRSGPKMSENA